MEGSENAGRGLHASTILGDKIYLFGGQPCLFCSSPTWGGINTAVIDMGGDTPMLSYVFATEESDEAPPSPALGTFSGSCAVSLPSGRALLVGGATKDGDNVSALPNVLWIFDPKTNGFRAVRTATGSAPSPRWGAACTYTRGIVYVHGGCDPSSSSGPVDPSTYMLNVTSFPWSWSKTDSGPNGPGPRCFGSASVYRNFVVFSGGQYGKADATISAGAGKKAGKASSARTPHQPLFSDNFEEDEVSSDSADPHWNDALLVTH
ncbi:hypothetical protein BC829DRAFT_255165 [Chytridium lagenaria]|nr:hypothetical protein BC829DRAFT_255165 [Chytridium lagenaria]